MTSPDPYRTPGTATPAPEKSLYPRVLADDGINRLVQTGEMVFVVESMKRDSMGEQSWHPRRTLSPKAPTAGGVVHHHDGCEELERWLCEQLAAKVSAS